MHFRNPLEISQKYLKTDAMEANKDGPLRASFLRVFRALYSMFAALSKQPRYIDHLGILTSAHDFKHRAKRSIKFFVVDF